MYIADIKNNIIRRITLVIFIIPVISIALIYNIGKGMINITVEILTEIPSAIRDCWNGTKR